MIDHGRSSGPRTGLLLRDVTLEHAFDPAMADLYADQALIRQTLPLAEARGDRSTYSDVTYTVNEDGSVAIEVARYSELEDYTSPIRITVAGGEGGPWRIVEELRACEFFADLLRAPPNRPSRRCGSST